MNKPAAIITGASTGIGKVLAIELSENYKVYLISRNKKKLNETKKIIEKNNNQCEIIATDLTKDSSYEKISKKISDKNNIELLVNNAGVAIFSDISNTSLEDWDITMNTNLRSSFLMTKLIIDNFKIKKNGKIVFINSGAGMKPFKNSTAYVASKYWSSCYYHSDF